ncbi:hypothetical protein [Henriciella marina]|uniref:hypothetical protein n=1 Tax=Henriciella marina TaxID=453851 RepID=UPI0003773294|nr:hypothetical protein [Henriciella marina]
MAGRGEPANDPAGRRNGGGLWLGAGAFVVACAVFALLFAFPSLRCEDGVSEVEIDPRAEAEAALALLGEDEVTRTYFRKLDAAFPSAADDLRETLLVALERSVPEGEIGLLILKAGTEPAFSNLDRLSKADIRYFNRLMDLARTDLEALDQSGAPFCQGSDLVEYSDLAEQEAYQFVQQRIEPGDPLYVFALEATGILLDAVRNARSNPQSRVAPSRADMSALQSVGASALFDPDVTLLLTTEGKSRREMNAALERVNFCELGVRMINRVSNLPETTKERLLSEAIDRVRRYGIRRIIWMMSTY